MISYEDLVINVSNHISSLCYSVLRFEPYRECEYKCLYCYARWYRGGVSAALGHFSSWLEELET